MSRLSDGTGERPDDPNLWSDVERIIELNDIRPSTVSSFHSFSKIKSRIIQITDVSENSIEQSEGEPRVLLNAEPEHELWAHVKNLLDTDMPEVVTDDSKESLERVKNWMAAMNPELLDAIHSKFEKSGIL